MAGLALLAGRDMVNRFARSGGPVVAQNTGLRQLGMVDSRNLLPVKGIVAAATTARRGNMVRWLGGGIKQAIGNVTQLALPRRTSKDAAFMTALALQVPMRAAQFEPGFKMIECRAAGAARRARKQAQQCQAQAHGNSSYLRHWTSPNESLE